MPYNHKEIENKWQKRWEETGVFNAEDSSEKPKFYCLIEFPYPSGAGLHIGHPRSYTAIDVLARKRRMQGYNVLYPIGWDAFGLPTENYAIKTGRKPQDVTAENISTFKRQLKALGLSFDWSREINTTDPEYYKWTQWMFLEFFKAGLAYKSKIPINWCLSCKIGLANEEVVDGKCERCGGQTEKREKEQWMIAITKYADRLLEDLDTVDYLEKIKIQQKNWIGKSEGIDIVYPIEGSSKTINVFTTRPDTNFGATFIVAAPDSQFIEQNLSDFPNTKEVNSYIQEARGKSDIERIAEGRKKTGVFTGLYAVNQLNNKRMPIYIGDFVLGNVGTGVVVGVPGHDLRDFEFAREMNIEVIRVVVGPDNDSSKITEAKQVQEETGTMINSGFLDGMDIHSATAKIMDYMEEKGWGKRAVNYKLRDWVFSRQRYWGEPIPLVHCDRCSWVPVPVEQLPVTLPDIEIYKPTDTGESPLAAIENWVNTKCPQCGGLAMRETDTMPNWAGSSWYFLAYAMKHTVDFQFPISNYQDVLKRWMPVDWYNGGMEHTTLHLLYSRFWNKFLFDKGYVPTSEPYAKRTSHGLIMAEDGTKMSKSKGNVVNPDEIVEQYGADAFRMYELFMGPFSEPVPWSTSGLVGIRRFLEKTASLSEIITDNEPQAITGALHQTIKKVSEDIENTHFNTAVSQMMIFVNLIKENKAIKKDTLSVFLRILCPFAPHIANELYESLGGTDILEKQSWPEYDQELAKDEMVDITVQINGKLRATIKASPSAIEQEVKDLALNDENVKKHLDGVEIIKFVYVTGRILSIVVKT